MSETTTTTGPTTTPGTAPERPRWTHPVHIGHLVMGLAFAGLVGVWAAIEYGAVPTTDLRWLLPLPWVLGGLAGLLAVLFSGRGRSQVIYAPTEPAPPATTEPVTHPEPSPGSPTDTTQEQ